MIGWFPGGLSQGSDTESGRSVKYQTCLIICPSTITIGESVTDPVNIAPHHQRINSYLQDGPSGTPPLNSTSCALPYFFEIFNTLVKEFLDAVGNIIASSYPNAPIKV